MYSGGINPAINDGDFRQLIQWIKRKRKSHKIFRHCRWYRKWNCIHIALYSVFAILFVCSQIRTEMYPNVGGCALASTISTLHPWPRTYTHKSHPKIQAPGRHPIRVYSSRYSVFYFIFSEPINWNQNEFRPFLQKGKKISMLIVHRSPFAVHHSQFHKIDYYYCSATRRWCFSFPFNDKHRAHTIQKVYNPNGNQNQKQNTKEKNFLSKIYWKKEEKMLENGRRSKHHPQKVKVISNLELYKIFLFLLCLNFSSPVSICRGKCLRFDWGEGIM